MPDNRDKPPGQGYFINGKEQALSILRGLNENERNRILTALQYKHPKIANELRKQTITFGSIYQLGQSSMNRVLGSLPAQIVAIALKGCSESEQKDVLRKVDRGYAAQVFQHLKNVNPTDDKILKAQGKILEKLSKYLSLQVH